MNNLTQYVHDNFTVSKAALDLIDNICDWASDHYEDKEGNLTQEGLHFMDRMLTGTGIELWNEEIIANWRETK